VFDTRVTLFRKNKLSIFGAPLDQSKVLNKPSVSESSETNGSAAAAAAVGNGSEAVSQPHNVGALAEIVGLKSKPELNGSTAKLLKVDSDYGRWTVQVVSSGHVCSLKPDNLKICSRSDADAACVISGRTEHGGFSETIAKQSRQFLEQFIETHSITRLAELAFDPQEAQRKGLWGRARFSGDPSPEVEMEVFLGQLESINQNRRRFLSAFVCDVSFVRDGLKRIYAGARTLSELLPRKSMCPLDIPLLHNVLICVKMLEIIQSSPLIAVKDQVLRSLFGNADFSGRCGLLAFPAFAKFPGPRIAQGSVTQERAATCECLMSSRAKDFMRQLWDAGPRLSDPVTHSHLARSLQAFQNDSTDRNAAANDFVTCFYALEYAAGIAQRDPTEYELRWSCCMFESHNYCSPAS
jgi:hypothetical protein